MSDGKDDDGKLQFALMPVFAERERAAVLTYGSIKYGPRCWMHVPNAIERYQHAAGRHWHAYRSGQHLDEESSLMHLAHLGVCVDFLIELEASRSPDGLNKSFLNRFEAAKAAAKAIKK